MPCPDVTFQLELCFQKLLEVITKLLSEDGRATQPSQLEAVPIPVPSVQSISCHQDGSRHTSQVLAGTGELQDQPRVGFGGEDPWRAGQPHYKLFYLSLENLRPAQRAKSRTRNAAAALPACVYICIDARGVKHQLF